MADNLYRFTFISLFNDLLKPFLTASVLKKPAEHGMVKFDFLNPRDFSDLKNQQIDDYQAGPGAGMVLMAPPIAAAISKAKSHASARSAVILLTPQGRPWTQQIAQKFIQDYRHLIFVSGNYEGFDERIRFLVDYEVSIGDYVLTSGELPSLVVANSLIRLVPSTIKAESVANDSFSNGRLDYPVYTKPNEFLGEKIPAVLISGHHQKIAEWRIIESLRKTLRLRPDLFLAFPLTNTERNLLQADRQLREEFSSLLTNDKK